MNLKSCAVRTRGDRSSYVNGERLGGDLGAGLSTSVRKRCRHACTKVCAGLWRRGPLVPTIKTVELSSQTPQPWLQNTGPLLSTAAIILLGCSIFSAARQMNKGGRKTVGPDDNLQSESQLLSEAQLDQVDRQNIEAPSLRQSPTVPMLAWGREGTAQLLFSRKAQEASQSEVPQLSAYEIFQLQWSYYSFLRRSQALKVLKSQERQSPPILVRLEKSSTSAGGELEIYGATDPTHLGAQVSLLPKPIRQP